MTAMFHFYVSQRALLFDEGGSPCFGRGNDGNMTALHPVTGGKAMSDYFSIRRTSLRSTGARTPASSCPRFSTAPASPTSAHIPCR